MILLAFTFAMILSISLTIIFLCTRPSRAGKILRVRLEDIRNPRRDSEDAAGGEHEGETELTLGGKVSVYLQRYRFSTRLELLLSQAHSTWTLGSMALLSTGVAATLSMLSFLIVPFAPIALAGAVLGVSLPYLWLCRKRSVRLAAFNRVLPDAIDLMARALRAGHSIQQSLELIAEQSSPPLSGEFAQVHQQQKFGIPFRDALLQMTHRIPSRDLHFVVTAILVQKETGGDLIDILDRTTEVIRDRLRVQGEIQVYTAQGRLTGWILSLLPVVMLAFISLVTPTYSFVLFHDPVGQKLLCTGTVMILVGSFLIRRIVDVEV